MTCDDYADRAEQDDAAERDEERRLAAEHQAHYEELDAAIRESQAAPFSPAVLAQHAAEERGRARALALRDEIEAAQNGDERWTERWARRANDPRFVLPDRPSGDPLRRDRGAM